MPLNVNEVQDNDFHKSKLACDHIRSLRVHSSSYIIIFTSLDTISPFANEIDR